MGESVEVYLDGGPATEQAASTIVNLTGPSPVILREGPVSADRIGAVLGLDAETLRG